MTTLSTTTKTRRGYWWLLVIGGVTVGAVGTGVVTGVIQTEVGRNEIIFTISEPSGPPMKAHFIDVGQGDATLLEFPCAAVLIDAGGDKQGEEDLLLYLERFFQRRKDLGNRLDSIFITHTHIDHNRALRDVVKAYDVGRYIHNGVYRGSGRHEAKWMGNNAEERSIAQLAVTQDDVAGHRYGLTNEIIDGIDCDTVDPEIFVLSGPHTENPGWTKGEFENGNNKSLVVLVKYGEFSMLFTGDLEDVAIDALVDYYEGTNVLDVDLYQVGHHGSENGTTFELLEAMTPQCAVISMGHWTDGAIPRPDGEYDSKNFTTFAYGHPRKKIVEWLSLVVSRRDKPIVVRVAHKAAHFVDYELGGAVYGTGWDGTVTLEAYPGGL